MSYKKPCAFRYGRPPCPSNSRWDDLNFSSVFFEQDQAWLATTRRQDITYLDALARWIRTAPKELRAMWFSTDRVAPIMSLRLEYQNYIQRNNQPPGADYGL
jgi:hypothetical protein